MKKTFKIFMFVTLFLTILITTVNATGISMNLDDYIPNDSEAENIVFSTNSLVPDTAETEVKDEDNSPRVVSTSTTSDDEFLTAENVLSIIIIVIGLLLVFLAVAILIRIK